MIGTERKKKGSGIVISEDTTDVPVTLVAGVDAGSTETRVCLADGHDVKLFVDESKAREALDSVTTTYRIPSTYAAMQDAWEIPPASSNLEDNYDSTVMLVRCSAATPLLGRTRVLRGRKVQDAMGLVPMYMDSSTNKTDNPVFYINILDSLGYAVMQKYNGAIPQDVTVHLTLSVRPKEQNRHCIKKMCDNLVGEFIFTWKGVRMSIKIVDINFSTEPEAQIAGTTAVCDLRTMCGERAEENKELADKLSYSDCFIHIEGGGSSIGVEVLRNGTIIDACSSTFPLGGNYLAQVFIDKYRELNGRTVTREAANNAIVTCMLRDGRNNLDVADVVASCKNQVGQDIVERLRHEVIDTLSDLSMRDVQFITLGGRLFLPDDRGITIGEYVGEYVGQLSEHTEVIILPESFIAQGNLEIGLNTIDTDALMNNTSTPTPPVNPSMNGFTGISTPDEEDSDGADDAD